MPSFRLHHHPSKSVNDEIHQSDRLWSVGGIHYGSITHEASMGKIYTYMNSLIFDGFSCRPSGIYQSDGSVMGNWMDAGTATLRSTMIRSRFLGLFVGYLLLQSYSTKESTSLEARRMHYTLGPP